MNKEDKGNEDAMPWYIPALELKLADGSTLVKPGKAIQRAQAYKVSRMTGVSTKTLLRLAEAGFITRSAITPCMTMYYPGEIEEFIRKTEADPDFWNDVRKKAFIEARTMRSLKPRGGA